jgi:IS4 transposase
MVFLTNNFDLPAVDIALLYKYRWKVELFFKWIKQHLKVKSFWGNSQNAVKTQIYIAIIGYYALIDPSYTLQIDPPKLTALF